MGSRSEELDMELASIANWGEGYGGGWECPGWGRGIGSHIKKAW